jgi:glucose-1-phosphate cytidylyltransferase
MKVVLFCGGLGMRLRSGSDTVPKPLVTVGNRPILWHVMQYYAHYGHRDFVLCLGHNGDAIRAYFRDQLDAPDWRITLADTGLLSNIGQRLTMARQYVDGDPIFLANYADGLTDLHLPDLISAFAASDKVGALVCTRPTLSCHFVRTSGDGTVLEIAGADQVELQVNGGYFVFRQEIFDYIRDGEDLLDGPLRRLVRAGRLLGYRHDGFWKNMDTFKDKQALDDLYASGRAPWEVWSAAAKPRRD